MRCPHCGRETVDQAVFCNYCGEQVAVACSSCERLNPPDSGFCHGCGRSLTESHAVPQEPAPATASRAVPSGVACPRCGATNEPASTYCYQCGLPLEGELRPAEVAGLGVASAHLYRSPRKRATWTVALLVGTGVIAVISFFSTLAEIDMLERVVAGEYLSEADLTANDDRQEAVDGFYLIVLIAAAVVFLLWIHRTSANLPTLGAEGRRFSPGWAVGWWFIPIMHLFRPYQVVREIWFGSDPDRPRVHLPAWREWSAPALLKWWWASWIISNLLGNAVFRGVLRSETAEDLITADQFGLAADAVTLVATVLAFLVIRRITKGQDAKYQELLDG